MGLFKNTSAKTANSTTKVNGIDVPVYDPAKDLPATTGNKKPLNWNNILLGIGTIVTTIVGIKNGTTDPVTGTYSPPLSQAVQEQQTARTGKNALLFVFIGLVVIVGGFWGIKKFGKK
jgi:multisubunit Na+/H+ antiporter MnhB subunit